VLHDFGGCAMKTYASKVLFNVRRIFEDLHMNPCIRLFPKIASHQQHMMESYWRFASYIYFQDGKILQNTFKCLFFKAKIIDLKSIWKPI
jgi:hypothetical protein